MQTKPTQTLTGHCHCGSVHYEAQGPILFQGTCTCRACQRATGALASPNVQVPMETFVVTRGSASQFKAESDEDCDAGVFHFCGRCGSQLYWVSASGTELACTTA